MEHSHEEANSHSDSQEIPRLHCNPKVQYPIVCEMNPLHIFPPYISKIVLILSSHLRLGIPSNLFQSGLSIKILYTSFISPMRAT